MKLEDDHISEEACPFLDEDLGSDVPTSGLARGAWLRLPPAAARPLALGLGAVLFVALALSSPAVGRGVAQLVRLRPGWTTLPGVVLSVVLWVLTSRLQSERWRGEAIDRLVLLLPLALGAGASCAAVVFAPALLVGWALLLGSALLLLPWLWRRRTERAWLLHKPGYTAGIVVIVLVLGGVPALAAWSLRYGAWSLQARVDAASRAWRGDGAGCLARLRVALPGTPWDRLALLAYGAQVGGRPGQELLQCLAPELQENETLAQSLKVDPKQLCKPEASDYNVDRFAAWFARQRALLQARWLVEALDPDAQREFGEGLAALAEAAGACADPFLVPQALLLHAADATGALGGCGLRWAQAPRDEWVREALVRWQAAGQAQAFTGDKFPLGGRVFFSSTHAKVTPRGFVQTEPVKSIALRPRPDGSTFEVGLDLRWLPAGQVGDKMNPWMEKHQRGNEVYLVACGDKLRAETLLDGLRDQWGFADRRRMGTGACPRGFGKTEHHVLPFAGGQAFVVAQYQTLSATSAQVRLGFTGTDPCRE